MGSEYVETMSAEQFEGQLEMEDPTQAITEYAM